MSNLDDRIRDSHQRILHVPPSEAGWQRLRQDLGKTPARRRFPPGFVWGVLLGFLGGAACVFGLGQFTQDTAVQTLPCPQVIAAPPPAEFPDLPKESAAAPFSSVSPAPYRTR